MDLITIVCDGNPDIEGAIDVLAPYIKDQQVTSLRPAAAMGEGLECSLRRDFRDKVISALNLAGFRIVEGGQP